MSLSANEKDVVDNPPTGEVVDRNDSVLVSYEDLKLANIKLIEADYRNKQIEMYKQIISNDSSIISNYESLNNKINLDCKKYYSQRNICAGVAVIAIITSVILIAK